MFTDNKNLRNTLGNPSVDIDLFTDYCDNQGAPIMMIHYFVHDKNDMLLEKMIISNKTYVKLYDGSIKRTHRPTIERIINEQDFCCFKNIEVTIKN